MSEAPDNNARILPPNRGLLPPGLRTLILLRYKAFLRRMIFGSTKRRIFTIVGFGLIAVYILPQLVIRQRTGIPAEAVRMWMPLGLLIFALMQWIMSPRRELARFQAAEIDLVVPGPFSRRQLLFYQIAYQLLPGIILGLWLAVFIRVGGSYLTTALGMALVTQCLNLLAGVAASILGLVRTRSWRKGLVVVMAAALAAAAAAGSWLAATIPWPGFGVAVGVGGGEPGAWLAWATEVRSSWAIEAICLPFKPYVEATVATSLAEAAPWAGLAVLMNIALIAVFIGLDRGEMEALVASSRKRLEAAEAQRRRGPDIANARKRAGRRTPMPARMWGAGPVAWRQFVTANRSAGVSVRIVVPLVILGGGFFLGRILREDTALGFMGLFGGIFAVMLPMVVKGDFRSDLDHMPMLKTLPMHPMAVVAGELATPLTIITGVQLMFFAAVCAGAADPLAAMWGAAIAAACVPASVMFLAIENAVFLMAPTRDWATSMQGSFDPARVARLWLITMAKLLVFATVVGVVGGTVFLVHSLGAPWFAAGIVGLAPLFGVIAGLLMLCKVAFEKFNVTEDQPG